MGVRDKVLVFSQKKLLVVTCSSTLGTFLPNPSEHLMTIQEECHRLKEWDDRGGSRCAECEYIRELFHT